LYFGGDYGALTAQPSRVKSISTTLGSVTAMEVGIWTPATGWYLKAMCIWRASVAGAPAGWRNASKLLTSRPWGPGSKAGARLAVEPASTSL